MARATRFSGVPSGGGGDRDEGAGQPGQGHREQRRPAAVDADSRCLLAGQPLDGGAQGDLQRVVGVGVGVGGPAVDDAGGQHRGVLAGAVHQDRRLLRAGRDQRVPLDLVHRPVRRGPQCGLVEARGGQHPAYALDMERLAGVAGAGEREQLAVEVETRLEHADRLHRLVRRAREDGGVRVAEGEHAAAVGGQRQQAAPVVALDEVRAHHLGEQGGAVRARVGGHARDPTAASPVCWTAPRGAGRRRWRHRSCSGRQPRR